MIKILNCGEVSDSEIFARTIPETNIEGIVSDIISDVKSRGDTALFEYTKKFDKAELSSLAVSKEEIDEALDTVEPEFMEILKE